MTEIKKEDNKKKKTWNNEKLQAVKEKLNGKG